MILFFKKGPLSVAAVDTRRRPGPADIEALSWLLGGAQLLKTSRMKGIFVGPRREMVTPWSTNAVEITRNMGVEGIERIEMFRRSLSASPAHDRMLERVYTVLDGDIFAASKHPDPIVTIDDIHSYNQQEGLALSPDEEAYLSSLAAKLGRKLTDSEVFGFSQVNSEHCRHKIFNAEFVVDGEKMPMSLFKLIKETSRRNPGRLVSAYKDNVAFVEGPEIDMFYPERPEQPDFFAVRKAPTVISLKAETHNFPTTVEPFNGAATGSGGEIRDRMGGGKASMPLAGTAVYMTSYPRNADQLPLNEKIIPLRKWLYQTPEEILVKASNGASDFCNKFGQPLICGSLLTFEHLEDDRLLAYDKVIMLAGGVGYALAGDAIKGVPEPDQAIVLLGGDNYRIGMGGGAVSSVNTGHYAGAIELNAVQRANPEMQKRVFNVIRALAENPANPVVSIHDHGAGGHLNALSELVEATGGLIEIDRLPVGDPTLSDKEIIGNESQERMGMVVGQEAVDRIRRIAERERAPMYVIGHTTADHRFTFAHDNGVKPMDLPLDDMFGSAPRTVMTDTTVEHTYREPVYDPAKAADYLKRVLELEAVGSKDWLTNKADRSVTGRVARQQCQGELQLPLSDCGVVALDYTGTCGIATSIGHAPQAALVDAATGSRLAIAEALTNLAGANLQGGLDAVSLSANWMWPCKNKGEDAALYRAVKACSDYAIGLGINIPTGKDSLSMTQNYADTRVMAPGTVIISAAGEVADVKLTAGPVIDTGLHASTLLYLPFSAGPMGLGGSALAQTLARVGGRLPEPLEPEAFRERFNAVQQLVARGNLIRAMHDVSAGGLVTTLLEMCFANTTGGVSVCLDELDCPDPVTAMFAENPALVMQVAEADLSEVKAALPWAIAIGTPTRERTLTVKHLRRKYAFSITAMREAWYAPSWRLDRQQSGERMADARRKNFAAQPVEWAMPAGYNPAEGNAEVKADAPVAAIIREKGVNGDREMAWSLHAAGFRVKDVHMTDLMSGRETLDEVRMIVFCGGFSNSDVAGSAKGWAGAIKFNEYASRAIERFYARPDTLSLGICNGCQLMVELNLLGGGDKAPRVATLGHNRSHKFESNFVSVKIASDTPAVMLEPLRGATLGIWVAHGEGRFALDETACGKKMQAVHYNRHGYPGNPNGSERDMAGLCSADGRHLAMMPHLERAIYPWQCGYWQGPAEAKATPWLDAFKAARRWLETH